MTTVDVVVLVAAAVLGLAGMRRGLVVGVASLAGLVGGAYVGARIAPGVIGEGSQWLPLATLAGAMAGGLVGQALAVLVARPVRAVVAFGPLRLVDAVGGLVLGAATALVLAWVVGAVLLYTPGQTELRRWAQESQILSTMNDQVPPERLMDALARVDPFAVLAGPEATVDPPMSAIAADPQVVAARESVVRVTGLACGLGIEGSGWIAAPGLVVTNAHVVAGVRTPRVDRGDGRFVDATVVAFSPKDDVAVLRVQGLEGRPLPLAEATPGRAVALLGFPGNGPYRATPARVGATVTTLGRDAYGRFPVGRTVTTVRGEIRPGNSGGPAVDAAGRVLTTVFAQRPGAKGGYGVPTARTRALLADAGATPLRTECVDR